MKVQAQVRVLQKQFQQNNEPKSMLKNNAQLNTHKNTYIEKADKKSKSRVTFDIKGNILNLDSSLAYFLY